MVRVQVSLRAEDLGNLAGRGWCGRGSRRSSPYAVVTTTESAVATSARVATATGSFEIGRTEVVHHNLSPRWTKILLVDHDDSPQGWTPLTITIRDCQRACDGDEVTREGTFRGEAEAKVGEEGELAFDDGDPTMGEASVEVGDVLKATGQTMRFDLDQGGSLYIHVTESICPNTRTLSSEITTGNFLCHIRALDLKNIESGFLGLGNVDPYFELSKEYIDPVSGINQWIPVYRSEHIPDIINPLWECFCVSVEKLCHGDMDAKIQISVLDHQKYTKHRLLGRTEVTPRWLTENVTRGGNASKGNAIKLEKEEEEEVGLIVVLKAEVLSA